MSKYRAMQRAMRRSQNAGDTVFTLFYPDGSERELRAPGNPRKCLRWLLERMADPSHPDALAARTCETYSSSDGSRLLDLISTSDKPGQQEAREIEIAEVHVNRKLQQQQIAAELGLPLLEEPEAPPEPAPEAAPGNVIEMPPSGGVQ
jgi:hypothetical protein